MAPIGRPPKHGVKPSFKLTQATAVVLFYDQARAAGEKCDVAIRQAVEKTRLRYPMLAISATEVKRILREWRPKGIQEGYLYSEEIVERNNEGQAASIELQKELMRRLGVKPLPFATHYRKVTCSYGPIPQVPRSNARKPKGIQ